MIDLGDPWPDLSVTTYNAAGVPENATTVVLTITQPDGTTATPAVTAAGSGVYTASFTPTQPGRHTARWVATGVNASAFTDAIDVDEAAPTGIVSLADVKARLNIPASNTAADEELRLYIDAATDFFEGEIGPIVRRTLTETVTPAGGRLWLSAPVISLTSMTAAYGYSGTYTVGNWSIDDRTLVANYGTSTYAWPVTVTYVGGRAIVPADLRVAALDYVKWMWETQRGATPLPLPGGEFETGPTPTVPYRIMQVVDRYRVPIVA